MGLAPLVFSGISSYSQDFQTILQRATTIASFPLEALKNEQADLTTKRQLTSDLNATVAAFQSALQNLADTAGERAISASVSDADKLRVDSVNTDLPATYSITEVTSLASAASETSVASFANSASTSVSATGDFRLTVGSETFDFTLAAEENNLIGLRDKINGLGAGVTATIFTVSATENYLSISANGTGAKTLSLVDDPNGAAASFLTADNQGSDLEFKLNGVAVSRTTNQVNDLIPGVSFSVTDTTESGEALAISLTSDRSKIADGIAEFVAAYNALRGKVAEQVGPAAGLLSGDILVREAQDYLRSAASFGLAEGNLRSLADLGVTFQQTGEATFDESVFSALSTDDLEDIFTFFGEETGLGQLAERVEGFTNPVNGLAALAISQYDRSDIRLDQQIADLTERISLTRASYLEKLQAADALLGQLENQQSIVDASIESLNLVLLGKRDE